MFHANHLGRHLRCVSVAIGIGLSAFATNARADGRGFFNFNFSNDVSSTFDAPGYYTHALNFLTDDNLSIDSAVFTGTGSGVATPATNTYSVVGTNSTFTNNPNNNLAGNSHGLASNFIYNGNPEVITLKNLIAGQPYTTTFYNVGFGAVGGRLVNISTSDGGVLNGYDQNKAGNGNGNLLFYDFVATAPTETFTITPQDPSNTFHNYALSNRLGVFNCVLSDNFYIGTSNGDPGGPALLNSNLPARQGGIVVKFGGGTVNYTSAGNVQVGNGPTGPVDRGNFLLAASGGAVSPNHNFLGSETGFGKNGMVLVSFDMAPNLSPDTANPSNTTEWGGISLGLAQANQTVFINNGARHFGILFRGNGGIQVFDGANDITGSGTAGANARWYADDGVNNVTNQLHHFDLIASDHTLAKIDIFADGLLVDTFTKPGGFSDGGNDYVNLVGSRIAGFDNLQFGQGGLAPEPATISVLGLSAIALLARRRRRAFH